MEQAQANPNLSSTPSTSIEDTITLLKQRRDNGFKLELPDQERPLGGITIKAAADQTPIQDNTKDVFTDVGGALVFGDAFRAGIKQNILDSWEYASRYANKQIHDKYGPTDPTSGVDTKFLHAQEWYSFFAQGLNQLHWIAKDFDFSATTVSGDSFTVDTIVLDILTGYLAADTISLSAVKAAIAILDGYKDNQSQLTIFDKNSNSKTKGTFQMGAIRDGGDGTAIVRTAALQINSSDSVGTVFWFFHYSTSNTAVSSATQDLVFNNQRYITLDAEGNSAKTLVEQAIVGTSDQFLEKKGQIE